MDSDPTPIPETLPNVVDVKESINRFLLGDQVGWFNKPVNLFPNVNGLWLVGSNIWKRAIGVPPPDFTADLDIIVPNVTVMEEVSRGWRRYRQDLFAIEINSARGRPGMTDGIRLLGAQGQYGRRRKLIDVWTLPEGLSIGEHLMSFPHPCQRVAFSPYLAVHQGGWDTPSSAPWLIRLVRTGLGVTPRLNNGTRSGERSEPLQAPGLENVLAQIRENPPQPPVSGPPVGYGPPAEMRITPAPQMYPGIMGPPPSALEQAQQLALTGKLDSKELVYKALGTTPADLGVPPPSRETMLAALTGSQGKEVTIEGWVIKRCKACNDPVAGGSEVCDPCTRRTPAGALAASTDLVLIELDDLPTKR